MTDAEGLRASRAGLLDARSARCYEADRAEAAGLLDADGAAWEVEQVRAMRAGLMTAEQVAERIAEETAAGLAGARVKWRAMRAEDEKAQARTAQGEAIARAKRFQALRDAKLWPADGAMAPLGEGLGSKRRAEIEAATVEAKRGLGRGREWHAVQAVEAGERLRGLLAGEVRAAAARLLAMGLHGRAVARALRMAEAGAARWMRRYSRREAMTRDEVGGAAGVDDRTAWETWSEEIRGVYRLTYLRAAAWGAWCATHASKLPAPCVVLVTRGLSGGTAENPRAGLLARGKRSDGAPVVEWSATGRTVAEESLVIHGRGAAWVWAGNRAARLANSIRYGARGRDGREVAAGWSISGSIESGIASGRPDQSAGSARRAGVEESIRFALAVHVRKARAAMRSARFKAARLRAKADRLMALAAMADAAGRKARANVARKVGRARLAAAGSAIGGAVRAMRSAAEDAEHIGGALRGRELDPDVFSGWFRDREALTDAGRKKAERLRESVAVHATL